MPEDPPPDTPITPPAPRRGSRALYFGDLVPVGFIKQYETNFSNNPLNSTSTGFNLNNEPSGLCEVQETGRFIPNPDLPSPQRFKTPIFKIVFAAVAEDMENLPTDPVTGLAATEKIYNIYVDYFWLTDERIRTTSGESNVAGFEVPGAGGTISHVVHIYALPTDLPSLLNRKSSHSYVAVGYMVEFDIIPYFLAGDVEIVGNILGPIFENLRFSEFSIKLLPSRSLGLYVGFGGLVTVSSLFPANFSELGGLSLPGLMGALLGGVISAVQATLSPSVHYKDFILKFGYSAVGSSTTYFDKQITITKDDLFDIDRKPVFVKYKNCIVVNKNIDPSADFIPKLFGVFKDPFEFNDLEKRNIGRGLTDSADHREGINIPRFLDKKPYICAVPKNKVITNIYTRQVRRYTRDNMNRELGFGGSGGQLLNPTTTIPEELIPGGGGNIQIYLPGITNPTYNSFNPITMYVTYESVKDPQFRQVNSYSIRASGLSNSPNLSTRNFYQNHSYVYDTFYVKNSLKYKPKFLDLSTINVDFDQQSNYINSSFPFFDTSSDSFIISSNFRTPEMVLDISNGKFEDSQFLSSVKAYRLSSRVVNQGSETYPLSEGVFIASNKIVNRDKQYSGIGYLDYFNNFTLLIGSSEIRDQKWWKDNFKNTENILNTEMYLEAGSFGGSSGGVEYLLKYDRSLVCNSLFVDDEKIGYDSALAEALSTITKLSDNGLGIGICILDLINIKNFNIKQGSGFLKYMPAVEAKNYIDLSDAFFSINKDPLWSMVVTSMGVPISNFGPANILGSFSTLNNLQPVNLTANGRLFLESIGGFTGANSFENLWVVSNGYDVKLGLSSDYYKNVALYAKQKDGFLRAYNFNNADFVEFNISPNVGYAFDKKVIKANQETINNTNNDIKWKGLPVDKFPFSQYGKVVVENENDKFFNINNKNTVLYKEIDGVYDKSDSSISIDVEYVISRLVIEVKELNIPANDDVSFLDYSISFDAPESNDLQSSNESLSFASFTKKLREDTNGIYSSVNIPNYKAYKMYLKGSIIDRINSSNFDVTIKVTVYDSILYDNLSFKSSDCYPAIDCFSQGYIVFVSNKDQTPSLDVYVTGDNDRRWSLFRNIFQSFVGDDIYQCAVKADLKGTTLYIMFSLNGTLLCKPIEGWTIARLKYHLQKPEAKNVFLLASSFANSSFYALSANVYDKIQKEKIIEIGIEEEIEPFNDLDHFARIEPAYIVQGRFAENPLLKDEYNNFLICNEALRYLNTQEAGSTSSQVVKVDVFVDNKIENITVEIPTLTSQYKTGLSSRIKFQNGSYPVREAMDDWDVNQPYTFEVLSDGSLICFILKDGFIHVMQSGDGKYWSQGLGLQSSYGFRPIKWSIEDQDSYINITTKKFFAGLCPPIDNISSCYDATSGKLTLFYVIGNTIFGQSFETHQINSQAADSMQKLLQTSFSVLEDYSRPYYIVGDIPENVIANILSGTNFVRFGIIQNNNPENTLYLKYMMSIISQSGSFFQSSSELKTNGKAPGACYVGGGLIRLYYEDDKDITRGIVIHDNFVKIDLLNRSKSIDDKLS